MKQSQGLPRNHRRDILLFVAATLAISMLISAAIPIGCAASLMGKYHRFIQDLGTSISYAREHDTLEVSIEGEQGGNLSQAEAVYKLIADTGMGSPLDEAPDGEPVAFAFGDGSSLQLFPTRIEEPGGETVDGLAVYYQRIDGSMFAYDTDRITYEDVIATIG